MKKISMLMLCTSTALFSCKKTTSTTIIKDINPTTLNHGTLNGSPFVKSIGVDGGTIEMPYNKIKITIPAGAVSKETKFTVQQVGISAFSGLDEGYRITADNNDLNKEIEIAFKYDQLDLENTSEDVLYLAFQDFNKNYWHRALNTEIDKQAKMLKVKTKNFNNDWVIERAFWVENDLYNLEENETIPVKIAMNDIRDFDGYNDLIYKTNTIRPESIDNWTVIGNGTITTEKKSENIYKAPSNLVLPTTEIININLKNLPGKYNPSRVSDKAILQTSVTIIPKQGYVRFLLNGTEYYSTTRSANYENGIITINTKIDDSKTFTFKINTDKPEMFGFGDFQNTKGKSGLIANINGKTYNHYRYDCIDDTRFYNGYVAVNNDFIKDRYIKGSFSLVAYYQTNCANDERLDISGEYRVNL